jgi:hypothetical protein
LVKYLLVWRVENQNNKIIPFGFYASISVREKCKTIVGLYYPGLPATTSSETSNKSDPGYGSQAGMRTRLA